MSKLDAPNLRDLDFLVHYMKMPSMGNVYLLGPDSGTWEDPDLLDLISFDAKKSDNWMSKAVVVIVVDWYHRLIGKKFKVPHHLK